MWISVTWPSLSHTHTRTLWAGGVGGGRRGASVRWSQVFSLLPSCVSVPCQCSVYICNGSGQIVEDKKFFLRGKYSANKQLGRRKLISHVFCPAASIKLPWRLFKLMGYLAAQLLAKTITGPKGSDPFRSNERINEWIKILKTTCHLPVTAA